MQGKWLLKGTFVKIVWVVSLGHMGDKYQEVSQRNGRCCSVPAGGGGGAVSVSLGDVGGEDMEVS